MMLESTVVSKSSDATKAKAAKIRRMSLFIWACILASWGIAIAVWAFSTLRVEWTGVLPQAGLSLLFLLGSEFYRSVRPDETLNCALDTAGQFFGFTPALALLNYAVITWGLPFHDNVMLAFDKAIGLDWVGFLWYLNNNTLLFNVLRLAYISFMWQLGVLFVVFIITKQSVRFQLVVLSYGLALFATIMISGFVPVLGAYAGHGLVDSFGTVLSGSQFADPSMGLKYFSSIQKLRSGEMGFDFATIEGMISFPSFHTSAAVIYIWAFWTTRWLRWPMLLLNLLLIVGTLIDGGHYLADVVCGVIIAIVAIYVASKIQLFQAAKAVV